MTSSFTDKVSLDHWERKDATVLEPDGARLLFQPGRPQKPPASALVWDSRGQESEGARLPLPWGSVSMPVCPCPAVGQTPILSPDKQPDE